MSTNDLIQYAVVTVILAYVVFRIGRSLMRWLRRRNGGTAPSACDGCALADNCRKKEDGRDKECR